MTDDKRDNLSTIIDDFVYDPPIPEFSCMSGPTGGWDNLRETLSSDYRLVDLILSSIKAKHLVWEPYKVPNPRVIIEASTCGRYLAHAGGAWCFMDETVFTQGSMETAKSEAEAHHQQTFKENLMIEESK